MRITFLIIKDYRHYHSLSSGPIGLAYLSAAAKARYPGTHVQIEVDPEQVIKSRPDIVGISAYTETYSQSIDAAKLIRSRLGPEVPIWLGGPHINASPKTLASAFDLGAIGEAEETFVELLGLYRENKLTPDHLAKVNGIVYWEDNQRKLTPERELVQTMDLILPPDRSVMRTYWPPQQKVIQWPQPIYTSRGCPFKCIFCIFSVLDQKVRYHSVERVVGEIEDILRHNPGQQSISIHDDLFALSKKRLYNLVQGIREAKLHKKVSFVCMAKASIFSDEMAKLMRDMNVSVVTFGLESGVPRLLQYLKGERARVEDNVKAIDICARHGLRMGGYFIIGTPSETYQELQESYWFIRKNYPPMSMAGVFRLTPFPGSKFWDEAVERGVVSNEMEDWRPFNYLDMDKKDFLFFNENYTLETFKAAYEHFCRIMDRNNLGISMEEHENRLMGHIEPAYKAVLQGLSQGQRVLEVSGFTRLSVTSVLEELSLDLCVDRVTPWELPQMELASDYDLVICNFALEQMPQAPAQSIQQLQQALAVGGQILFSIYNPRHTSMLMRLIMGTWDNELWGFRPFDMFKFLTPEHLLKLLQAQGLQAQHISAFRDEGQSQMQKIAENRARPILELLLKSIPGTRLETFQEFAYTVFTAPKEGIEKHGRYIQASRQSGQV